MIDVSLLTAPLPGNVPQGVDPKYELAYSRMQTELKKLTSVSAAPVDWSVVSSAAEEVLTSVGKDIPAAAYLAVALGHADGLAGLPEQMHWQTCVGNGGIPPFPLLAACAHEATASTGGRSALWLCLLPGTKSHLLTKLYLPPRWMP